MRYGLKVNPATWDEASEWAATAEDVGFDALWTGDNIRHPRDPSTPVHAGPELLAAWAATTTRISVGLLIANVVFRSPMLLAKQAVTLDHVSAGRFQLGVGAGMWPTDHAMAGVPPWPAKERSARLDEFVRIVDRLLSGDASDHDGAYYSYHDAAMSPAPVQQRIPLIVAANASASLEVVAGHADAWVTFAGQAAEEDFYHASIQRMRALDRLCLERDREPGTVRRILLAYGSLQPWSGADALPRLTERYRDIGFDEIVCYAPKPDERGTFEKAVSRLKAL